VREAGLEPRSDLGSSHLIRPAESIKDGSWQRRGRLTPIIEVISLSYDGHDYAMPLEVLCHGLLLRTPENDLRDPMGP
jgi:hypothetical protein